MSLRAVLSALLLLAAAPAAAQPSVSLEFTSGRVSLEAQNAPLRVILAEWARLGGATIVNADRLAGPPVTLQLAGVTERQALDTLLRDVAGYVLAPRRAGTPGASAFDRIMILPTSVGPRNPPPAAPTAMTGPRPVIMPRPPIVGVPGEEPAFGETEFPGEQPMPVRLVPPRPMVDQPPGGELPFEPEVFEEPDPAAAPSPAPPARGNRFGVPFGTTTTPGVIVPVPEPEQPGAPPPGQ